jgi:hypothetical protein
LTPTVLKGYHKMYLENSIYNMKKKVAGKNKSFFFKKKAYLLKYNSHATQLTESVHYNSVIFSIFKTIV